MISINAQKYATTFIHDKKKKNIFVVSNVGVGGNFTNWVRKLLETPQLTPQEMATDCRAPRGPGRRQDVHCPRPHLSWTHV